MVIFIAHTVVRKDNEEDCLSFFKAGNGKRVFGMWQRMVPFSAGTNDEYNGSNQDFITSFAIRL